MIIMRFSFVVAKVIHIYLAFSYVALTAYFVWHIKIQEISYQKIF